MSLDFRFPLGRANSPICRWCKAPRVVERRTPWSPPYLICRTCDVPSSDSAITTTITSTEEST